MTERKDTPRRSRRRCESGQVAIEYLGFIPLLLIVGLLAIQLGIAAYAANQAGTAARVAARTASQDALDQELDPEPAGHAAISSWLSDDLKFDPPGVNARDVTYTARIKVPSVIPGMAGRWGEATRSSTMPLD